MNALGLKATQVMCIYYLASNPEELTAADLCTKCNEDKAAINDFPLIPRYVVLDPKVTLSLPPNPM